MSVLIAKTDMTKRSPSLHAKYLKIFIFCIDNSGKTADGSKGRPIAGAGRLTVQIVTSYEAQEGKLDWALYCIGSNLQ